MEFYSDSFNKLAFSELAKDAKKWDCSRLNTIDMYLKLQTVCKTSRCSDLFLR